MTTNLYTAKGFNTPGGDAIIRARYVLEVRSDEPTRRCELLLRNVRKFGTITNTLAAACALDGTLRVLRSDGTIGTLSE
jgi:hypothetical protein